MWTFAFLKLRSDVDAFVSLAKTSVRDVVHVDDTHTVILVAAEFITDAAAALLLTHSTALPGVDSRLIWYQSYMASELRQQYATALKHRREMGDAVSSLTLRWEEMFRKPGVN